MHENLLVVFYIEQLHNGAPVPTAKQFVNIDIYAAVAVVLNTHLNQIFSKISLLKNIPIFPRFIHESSVFVLFFLVIERSAFEIDCKYSEFPFTYARLVWC